MKAFIFPGQASQYVGMGLDLYNEHELARQYFDSANEILELDLKETCFNGPEEKLVRTEYTQPAIFVHSIIINELLKSAGIKPDIVAGHSLGEYSALVAAGVFSFEDGLTAVKLRSQLMQKCCDTYAGTMAAVVGLDFKQVDQAIAEIDGVSPANYNSPEQIAITGTTTGVAVACEVLKQAGAKRVVPLAVGGAYHSPLMAEAKTGLSKFINAIKFNEFACPIVANVTGKVVDDPGTMCELLIEQITSPVLWHPSMETIYARGITEFWEIGPGKVLQGLLKRSFKDREYKAVGVDKAEDLKNIIRK